MSSGGKGLWKINFLLHVFNDVNYTYSNKTSFQRCRMGTLMRKISTVSNFNSFIIYLQAVSNFLFKSTQKYPYKNFPSNLNRGNSIKTDTEKTKRIFIEFYRFNFEFYPFRLELIQNLSGSALNFTDSARNFSHSAESDKLSCTNQIPRIFIFY